MSPRKERLDQLVEHTRKLLRGNPELDRQSIYNELEDHLIIQWGLSQGARKDYVLSIAAILKEELTKRDSEIEAKVPKIDGVFYGKPASVVSKEKAFAEIFRVLAGPDNNSVEGKLL